MIDALLIVAIVALNVALNVTAVFVVLNIREKNRR